MKPPKKSKLVGSKPEKPSAQAPAPIADQPQSEAPLLKYHHIAQLFPLMSIEELEELTADIKINGQRDRIIMFESKILDGRNRYLACRKNDLEPKTMEFSDGDPVAFVISKNVHRRNLSSSQRAMIAAELPRLKKGDVATQKTGASSETPISSEQAAKIMGVSRAHVARAKKVIKDGPQWAIEDVKDGELSLGKAERIIRDQAKKESAASPEVSEGVAPVEAVLDSEPGVDEGDHKTASTIGAKQSAKQAISEMKKIPKCDPGREEAFRMIMAFVRKNYPDLEDEK